MNRTRASAALPSVIGVPGSDFTRGGVASLAALVSGRVPRMSIGALDPAIHESPALAGALSA
jgi:hypothetical protein